MDLLGVGNRGALQRVVDPLSITPFIEFIHAHNIFRIIVLYGHQVAEFTVPGFFVCYKITNLNIDLS